MYRERGTYAEGGQKAGLQEVFGDSETVNGRGLGSLEQYVQESRGAMSPSSDTL